MRKILINIILIIMMTVVILYADNCPKEISQEFSESFKEKFSDWRSVTLIGISCTQKENNIMLIVNYRSVGTTALKGWFANWDVVTGSARKIFQSAFNFNQVIFVELHFYNPYLDEFGNKYLKHEVTMQMDRDLAEKINWENFTNDMLYRLLDKKGFFEVVNGEKITEN
ncbi:MAG: hypothetical protein ACTSQN_17320 [Candidatus Heimdallarchaeota archaeon]